MSFYDLSHEFEANKAFERLNLLIGKGVKIELRQVRKNRSQNQNKYYWALMNEISEHTGYTPDEAHCLARRAVRFMYEKNGQYFLKSTKGCDTKEMSVLTESIRNWASRDLDLYLPSAVEFEEQWEYYENRKNLR